MTIFVPESLLRHAKKREVALTIDTTTIGPLQIKNVVRMALTGVITGDSISAHLAKAIRMKLGLPVVVRGPYKRVSWENMPKDSHMFDIITASCVAEKLAGRDTQTYVKKARQYVQFIDLIADKPASFEKTYFYGLNTDKLLTDISELGATKELNSMLDKLIAGQLPTIELNYGG